MNLQENIRRILREELNESTFFRRRVDMELFEKEFYEILNYTTDIFLSYRNGGETVTFLKFKRRVMDYLIDNYHSELTDGGLNDFPYDKVYEYFSNHFHSKIKNKYDRIFGNNINESIRILKEDEELNPDKRVYDYDKERDTVPERLPFDIDKLVNSGVVFVTPAIDGDPDSKTYKKWLEEPYTHLLTLHNVKHSSEDGWIKKAITKVAPTKAYKGNFVDKIYDGKYNQILWGLEKLGINPMDMLIDMNIQENISRIQSMMGAIKELSETTDDVVGKEFWFEYHCFESPKSCDAELWYRTHNKVLVLSIVELGCGDTKLERLLEGCPRVYRVVFEDGFEYDVFEDELMESKEEFERPDAPKRNQQEQISRIQSMMEINKSWEHNVKVRIKDILPINSDGQSLQDAIANVKDGLISHSEDNVLLYKVGKKYEIGDGFHRIAQKILNGEKYIIADIKTSEE